MVTPRSKQRCGLHVVRRYTPHKHQEEFGENAQVGIKLLTGSAEVDEWVQRLKKDNNNKTAVVCPLLLRKVFAVEPAGLEAASVSCSHINTTGQAQK